MKMKNEKAITLIALMVTVLVFLFLAGITIGVLGGENGAIRTTINARKVTKISEELESVQLAAILASGENLNTDIEQENLEKCLSDKFNKNVTVEIVENKYIYQGENGKYLIDKSR